jgi:hypothetical protein
MFVKHYDRICGHNNFLDITKLNIEDAVARLDKGKCPYCKVGLRFETDDKYNKTYCTSCPYEAWSNKIYDVSDFYDYDEY